MESASSDACSEDSQMEQTGDMIRINLNLGKMYITVTCTSNDDPDKVARNVAR